MNYRLLACCVLLISVCLAPTTAQPQGTTAAPSPPHAQTLTGRALSSGAHQGVVQTPDGLTAITPTASFTSEIMEAPATFNYILMHWQAQVPDGASILVEGRVSADGTEWSRWGHFDASDDLLDARDAPGTFWSGTVYAGESRWWQVRVTLTSPAGDNTGTTPQAPGSSLPPAAAPTLESITISTVDTRNDTPENLRPTAPLAPAQAEVNARPGFVTRAQWGGSEVLNNSVPADYYRADHLVVHHTADSNTLRDGEASWAARVLAEWRFHTYSSGRGWGDIGYNWVIDPNGVVYEGRRGSSDLDRDAVGFHDTANYGSMGVVLIGTYGNVAPPAAMQDSLTKLLVWKAQQRQIDPYGSSYYYGCARSRYCAPFHPGSIVQNLAGHREVLPGHTTCPGDQAINILPSVRRQVATALRPVERVDNGDLAIDDTETGFARVSGSWYDAAYGYNGRTLYTFTTSGTSENAARWRPNIPEDGHYKVEAYLPHGVDANGQAIPGRPTEKAKYVVTHADGTTSIVKSQTITDEWLDLGTYQFDAGTDGNVYLNDVTGEPYSSANRRPIFFDAMRWTYVPDVQPEIELADVRVLTPTLTAGEVVRVAFTVRNTGTVTIQSQGPTSGTAGDLTSGYVYDENECFLSNSGQSYPTWAKATGRFRVTLGATEDGKTLGADCQGDTGGNPWRWGFGPDLQSGETRTIIGAVRMQNWSTNPRTVTLTAGLVNENIRYTTRDVPITTLTVLPESRAPRVSQTDGRGRPLAQVYALKMTPQSLLARTANPLSVVEDGFVGAFPWDGSDLNWGATGPLSQTDQFVVEQVRPFVAPISGSYSFRLDTDDGAWLWIDGRVILDNHGLHDDAPVTTTLYLRAGMHTLGFKYFEYYGLAHAQYRWQMPGTDTWNTIPVLPTTNTSDSKVVVSAGQPVLVAADDLGGGGISMMSYWLDGDSDEQITSDSMVPLNGLADGVHTLRYRAYDQVPNISIDQTITFTVNITAPQTLSTQLLPTGAIKLNWTSSSDARSFLVEMQDMAQRVWQPATTTTVTNTVVLGTPDHSYQFRITATDGMYQRVSNTTVPIAVPANAKRYQIGLPLIRR